MNAYRELAAAIVLQAVKDYRTAIRWRRRHPGNKWARMRIREIERFFRSEWYGQLSDVDPHELLQRLRQEVEK